MIALLWDKSRPPCSMIQGCHLLHGTVYFCGYPTPPPRKKQGPAGLTRGASNRVLEAVGTYDFDLKFKDHTVKQQMTVFQELNSVMILGMDFITNPKLTFLPTRQEFWWGILTSGTNDNARSFSEPRLGRSPWHSCGCR